MWKNISRIKKNRKVKFNNRDTIKLSDISRGLKWENTSSISGINYISPKENIYECISNIEKINDDTFNTGLISSIFTEKKLNNDKPYIKIDVPSYYVDLNFKLRKYIWMYNRVWRGWDDATSRIFYIYINLKFYVNSELIAEIITNTKPYCYYNNIGNPTRIIVYNKDFIIAPISYAGEGANYYVHHTDSVDYSMNIGINVNIYSRKYMDKFDFKARMSVGGWLDEHDITSESSMDISYLYKSESLVNSEGLAIFYENN